MNFDEVINKRHSIREFENKKVPKSILAKLVIDATKAPSGANWQPWSFYIIYSEKSRQKIASILKKSLEIQKKEVSKLPSKLKKIIINFYSNMGGCPHVVFAYVDKEKDENYRNTKILSVAAAIENLILSATEKGLGTCWIGTFKTSKGLEKKISNYLKIKNKELVAGILVGYSKKGAKPLKRSKKKLKEVLFWK